MIYVFDTNAFIVLKNFYPDTFPSLWSRMEDLIANEKIVSVREVFNELHNYNAAKLPNVCEHFEVPCHNLETFMKVQGWTF